MNLIDAISANTSASSPVQLSQSSLFPRQYGSLHDAVDNFFTAADPENAEIERREQRLERMRIVGGLCPAPAARPFYLLGLDTTGQPRPFAVTLEDRGCHYHPNPAPGNKPITVGHKYSTLAALPEKIGGYPAPWVIPVSIQRVATDKKATETGAEQVDDLLNDPSLPFGDHLCALAGDTEYSACSFLGEVVKHENLATIVRVRGNRTFYNMPELSTFSRGKGHPRWYGAPFTLNDPSSHREPDEVQTIPHELKNGRKCEVTIKAWRNMLMRGKHGIPMHKHPFTLICITIKDEKGRDVFKRPLWLIIIGERRDEISLIDAFNAYRQRYDLEHFFRFGKNRLLMASCQTPDVEHEENWWEIVGLAYVNLYTAASLANIVPYPWERWLPNNKEPDTESLPSPSMVQRDLPRIIQAFGTPARPPKPRGKSPGRKKGTSPGKRPPIPIVKKGKKDTEKMSVPP
jgi:hypothetical protein